MRRLIGMLLGCVTFSISAVFIHNAFLLNDYRATVSDQKVEIFIEPGDSGTEIAQKLYKSGVIKASKVFYKIAINEKRSKSISPGVHEIDLKISSRAAFEQLLDGKRNRGLFGFKEGLRKNEILDLLSKSNLVEGVLSKNVNPDKKYNTSNLEGFLFPAQYAFIPGLSMDDAVQQMVDRFNLAAKASKIDQGYSGFTPYELLIIASMLQAEGDVQDLALVRNSELLDKKVVRRELEATLNLTPEMSISDELVVYLQDILGLDENKIKNIIGVYSDYSTKAELG